MIKTLFRNKIASNASWIVISKAIQVLINFFVLILTARLLGPSNYGLLDYALAYPTFFSSLCTLGINSILVKELIDGGKSREGTIMGSSLFIRLVASFVCTLITVVLTLIIDKNDAIAQMVVILCSTVLIFQALDVFIYWFQSRLASKTVAITTLIAYIITSIYRIILILNSASVKYFALCYSLDALLVGVALWYEYKKDGGDKLSISKDYIGSLLSKSSSFIIVNVMIAIYTQIDKIMIKTMVGTQENGYYATALTICNAWCFVLTAIIDSFYPVIAEKHKTNKDDYKKMNVYLYRLVFYISIGVSIIITLCAPFVVNVLFGEAYMPAVSVLRIMTWYVCLSYVGTARNIWVACENQQSKIKYVYIVSAIANVLLNYLLIPYLGANGAAIATIVTQFICILVVPFFIKELKENSSLVVESLFFIKHKK